MVSWTDLAPTLLDWMGAAGPAHYGLTGRSWFPILEQEDPTGWDEVYASHQLHEIHMYYPMRAVRSRQYAYIRNLAPEREYPLAKDILDSPSWKAILAGGVKDLGVRGLDAALHRPAEELYDVTRDRDQVRNLATDPAFDSVLADMRRRLEAFADRTNDPWLVGERPAP
jgi:N-sulfoglucosamine sulfohydrolase